MSILVGDNFSYSAAKPLDGRLKYDTVANMKAVADATMYDGCLAYCTATDKTYQWKSTNTVDSTLGRWREFETGGGGGAGSDTTAYHTDDATIATVESADTFAMYSTTANESRRFTWGNIKLFLKTYFDTLYNKYTLPTATASVLGGVKVGNSLSISDGVLDCSVPILGSINRSDLYDTTEKVIGKWTDGKPLYQKTFTITVPTTSTDGSATANYYTIGSSVDTVVKLDGSINASGAYIPLDKIASATSKNSTTASEHVHANKYVALAVFNNSHATTANRNKLRVENTNTGYNGLTGYVTIQYTKTTDSANSYNYADENDYSTSEKIVGTWIDGSLIYQKTISFTTSSSGGAKTIGSITSLKNVVDIKGVLFLASAVVPLAWLYSTDGTNPAYVGAIVSGTNVQVMSGGADYNNKSGYVTIQYTKT